MSTPTPSLLPEHIATEQPVIHPALDWRDNRLLMGVRLAGAGRAVLTSDGQILDLDQLSWPICDRAGNFDRSPVTESVARRFQNGYGAPGNPESAYALVNVPILLAAYYRRFIVFPEPWWPETLALWSLGTYLYPIFSAYPYLRISSPEPGCGKSLLGQIIANLTFNGELMVSPTEANIFRLAEAERGTQVWDEVENENNTEQNRLHAMKAALLNGYRAGGGIPRQERRSNGQFTTVRFHVYVPRVLIGLSDLPSVVDQRILELTLHRRNTSEPIERYLPDQRHAEERELREMCALWALSYCRAVAHRYRSQELATLLERLLRQAGRLSDDLLLPLLAVGDAPRDNDVRSQTVITPLVRRFVHQAAPILGQRWTERSDSIPQLLVAVLNILEERGEVTPSELADAVRERIATSISAEQLSRQLRRYGIRSFKRNGRRIFSVSAAQIEDLRARYGIAARGEPDQRSLPPGQEGQIGQ